MIQLKKRLPGLIWVILFISSFIQAQEEIEEIEALRSGTLPNGFQYFIKDVEEPVAKTTMRLYIKAGFDHEDSLQQQMAHLIEHLAFKPTVHTPTSIKDEAFLDRLGMNIRDIGGTTSNLHTRYLFDAPQNHPKAFQTGLAWFKDIAMQLPLTSEHINQEKGSVWQELISGSQDHEDYFKAERNLEAQLFPFRKSYDRLSHHIQNFSHKDLRRFYKDWYRPDLMAIVVVGNLKDIQETEKHIQETFTDIPEHQEPYPHIDIHTAHQKSPAQFKVQVWEKGFDPSKKEEVEYHWYIRQPELVNSLHTREGYQRYIAFQLLSRVLHQRLEEANSPALIGSAKNKDTYTYGGNPFSLALYFTTFPSKSKEAFQQVVIPLLQLKEQGVMAEEWKRIKEDYLKESLQSEVSYWNEELRDYWLKNEVLFSKKNEIFHQWVQELSTENMNAYILQFLSSPPKDIGIIAPQGNKALNFTEEEIRAWVEEAYLRPVPIYQPPKVVKSLYNEVQKEELALGAYTTKAPAIPETHEIVLSNGVRVVLKSYKPTPGLREHSIKISGYTAHGATCFSKTDYYSALNAPSVITHHGVGGVSSKEIKSLMDYAEIMSCRSYIDYKESSLQAEGNLKHTEEILQLLSLYFQPVNPQDIDFDAWQKEALETRKSQKNIHEDFRNAIRKVVQDSAIPPSFNFRYLKGEEAILSIGKTEEKRSLEIYQHVFGAPEQWTFLITGNFKIEDVIPLLQRYLGNIKPTVQKLRCTPTRQKTFKASGPVKKEILSNTPMENGMYDASYYQEQRGKSPWKEILELRVLGQVMQRKLNRLRYEKGFSVYNFGGYGIYNPDEKRYRLYFQVACQPKELYPIQKEIQFIVKELRAGEIPKEYLKQAKQSIKGRFKVPVLKQHRQFHELLFQHLRYEEAWVSLKNYEKFIDQIEMEDMVRLSKKYLKEKNKIEVIMSDEAL
ncbi:insulinase family protein [Mesonia ostreae]|uniref:Insulinase family protein n=1 Tax=Mesonia ostreae TaxID=861110 RepID=A0ABU2KJN5_9FLAO|nr:insulinase family protein [Mesonia ostreae]MDT0294897.1 insulinase family protein [Mesonia ostreae]